MEKLRIDLSQPQEELKKTTGEVDDLRNELKGLDGMQIDIDVNADVEKAERLAENMGHATRVAAGLAGGVEVVQGALHLMGVESETAEKAIGDMMAVMEIANGFSAIADGVESFVKLSKAVKTSTWFTKLFRRAKDQETITVQTNTWAQRANAFAIRATTAATQGLKAALVSTGIGAIVVGIGVALQAAAEAMGAFNDEVEEFDGGDLELSNSIDEIDDKIARLRERRLGEEKRILGKTKKEYQDQLTNSQKELETLEEHQKKIKKLQETIEFGRQLVGSTDWVTPFDKNWKTSQLWREELKKNIKAAEEELARTKKVIEDITKKPLDIDTDLDQMDNVLKRVDKMVEKAKKSYTLAEEGLKNFDADEEKAKKKADEDRNKRIQDAAARAKADKENAMKSLQASLSGITLEQLDDYQKEYKIIEDEYIKLQGEIQALLTGETAAEALSLAEADFKRKEQELIAKFRQNTDNILLNMLSPRDKEIRANEDAYKKDLENLKINFNNKIITEKEYDELSLKVLDQYNKNRQEIIDKYTQEEQDKIAASLRETVEKERMILIQGYRGGEGGIEDLYNRGEYVAAAERNQQMVMDDIALLETYKESLMEIGFDVSEVDAEIAEASIAYAQAEKEVMQAKIDSMNVMLDTFNTAAASIIASGDAISQEWNNVFSTLQTGLNQIGESLKTNGKGWQAYTQVVGSAFNVLGSTFSAIAADQNENTKEGFEKQKKFETAAAVMNTLGGIINVITSVWNPVNAWLTPWGQAALSASMSSALAVMGGIQIKKIKNTKFDGGEGDVAPSLNAMSAMAPSVNVASLVEGASVEGETKDTRVYVSETDITNTQKRVNVAETESRY